MTGEARGTKWHMRISPCDLDRMSTDLAVSKAIRSKQRRAASYLGSYEVNHNCRGGYRPD